MYARPPLAPAAAPYPMSYAWCPNFVASTTWSRRPASTSPRISSDPPPPPYVSAVSSRVTPASRAASTTARVPATSSRRPKVLPPSPATDTSSPELPTDLYRIPLLPPSRAPPLILLLAPGTDRTGHGVRCLPANRHIDMGTARIVRQAGAGVWPPLGRPHQARLDGLKAGQQGPHLIAGPRMRAESRPFKNLDGCLGGFRGAVQRHMGHDEEAPGREGRQQRADQRGGVVLVGDVGQDVSRVHRRRHGDVDQPGELGVAQDRSRLTQVVLDDGGTGDAAHHVPHVHDDHQVGVQQDNPRALRQHTPP